MGRASTPPVVVVVVVVVVAANRASRRLVLTSVFLRFWAFWAFCCCAGGWVGGWVGGVITTWLTASCCTKSKNCCKYQCFGHDRQRQ